MKATLLTAVVVAATLMCSPGPPGLPIEGFDLVGHGTLRVSMPIVDPEFPGLLLPSWGYAFVAPEPASGVLLIVAAGLLGLAQWRRHRTLTGSSPRRGS